ncbi:MAG: CHC2 zinc finger domain-containing protein [Cytobacillus gottheilii]|uniref:CHC2 zinc finger domain-containing protein n=1 Tax=Cytobacillus gottheilii TaxID=859144 RepID=UPI00346429D6
MGAIDLIKYHVPIKEALARYAGVNFLRTRTSRTRFNVNCPYHNDRSPSFTIYTDTNTFRCWSGCNDGKSGDVIDVVKLSYNIDTKEAIKVLMADFGLDGNNTEAFKEWQKKRAEHQRLTALTAGLNEKIIKSMDTLKRLEKLIQVQLNAIKTVDALERVGELYHLVRQIDYWLDCLIDDNPIIQFETLAEVERFIKKMSIKAR